MSIVLAATKTSEQYWLMNLLGWAPETNEHYQEYLMIEDDTKTHQDEDHHSWGHSNSSMETRSDSWEWIDSKELVVTATQDTIPTEYEEFQNLFKQPEQPELPKYGPHDHMIPIEKGQNLTCKKIYSMLEKESHSL